MSPDEESGSGKLHQAPRSLPLQDTWSLLSLIPPGPGGTWGWAWGLQGPLARAGWRVDAWSVHPAGNIVNYWSPEVMYRKGHFPPLTQTVPSCLIACFPNFPWKRLGMGVNSEPIILLESSLQGTTGCDPFLFGVKVWTLWMRLIQGLNGGEALPTWYYRGVALSTPSPQVLTYLSGRLAKLEKWEIYIPRHLRCARLCVYHLLQFSLRHPNKTNVVAVVPVAMLCQIACENGQ